jgi:hypothetical protein
MIGAIERDGWRVEFFRHNDRVAHRILRQTADGPLQVAESQEGTFAEHWPGSPPFQQVHFEQRESGEVALLVGMAGRSHWSGSVEIRPELGGPVWDVACRASDAAQCLGASYRLAVPAQPSGDQLLLHADGEIVGTAMSFELDAPMRMELGAGVLRWRLGPPPVGQPRTYRWRYWFTGPSSDPDAEEAAEDANTAGEAVE